MSWSHTFTPVAFQEYSEAVTWYKQHSLQAAGNFIKEVTIRIQSICSDPYRYRNRYKNFYETSVKKFLFYIVYFMDDEKKVVVVASIYHHKRSAKRKYRKKT